MFMYNIGSIQHIFYNINTVLKCKTVFCEILNFLPEVKSSIKQNSQNHELWCLWFLIIFFFL